MRVALLNVVALTRSIIRSHMPRLGAWAASREIRDLRPVLPAVTCAAQATMLTGRAPSEHGIVGNGWLDRDLGEVHFWKQSASLVQRPRLIDEEIEGCCANLFWWNAMYSRASVTVTPRPQYRADGRKIPDIWTEPAPLRDELQRELGAFPLFRFWGPMADLTSSRWIADAARVVEKRFHPRLSLIYIPHLDYELQRSGPESASSMRAMGEADELVSSLITDLEACGVTVILVSEYGIEPVSRSVSLNRMLREWGLLRIRDEMGREYVDPMGSRAFTVCDHQVAHVYAPEEATCRMLSERFASVDGVEEVLRGESLSSRGLAHARSGDLVLVARRGRWFSYPWWEDSSRAPDYARTVDIHRKPGYDPLELFLDPHRRFIRASLMARLAARKLGLRALLSVVPLDESLVRGSHGRDVVEPGMGPVLVAPEALTEGLGVQGSAHVYAILRRILGLTPP